MILLVNTYSAHNKLLLCFYMTNSSNAAYSDGKSQRYALHQPGSLESTLQEGHQETEPYYESLGPSHKQHTQPAEYEEFQPSSLMTITSQLPLLNQDPEPYEVTGGGAGNTLEDGHMNGIYETVRDPGKFTSQYQSKDIEQNNDSPDNHVYFTLEPHA